MLHEKFREADKLVFYPGLSAAEQERLKTLISELKVELDAEHKRMKQPDADLSRYERDFYQPAVKSAMVKLGSLKTNHRPNEKWRNIIYEIRFEISDMLTQIKQDQND